MAVMKLQAKLDSECVVADSALDWEMKCSNDGPNYNTIFSECVVTLARPLEMRSADRCLHQAYRGGTLLSTRTSTRTVTWVRTPKGGVIPDGISVN